MTTAADTPTRLTDRKHAAILDAAVAEFRAAGFEATTMDRIAAAAGVSKRTVYNHFPSKDALFLRILEEMFTRGVGGPDLAYRADRPLRAQLMELVEQKLRLLDDPHFVDLARVAIAAGLHSPELARQMLERLGDREEGITTWVRAAAADGRLKTPDPLFASHQLQSLVKGFAFWPQMSMGQPALDAAQQRQVAEGAVDMFIARYG
ncbi:TetR/AcrR family transcriptional regulator [Luteimonas sp. 3794]|uniref:TetR/AcrR family transcriptional regulator n=1 Tax=Luteimonas sp. 3794 TaxID=2817730 RepID=UPI002863A051|nr:TetR/AcrR family transcriptional regulator [Luteimonas sp. 3794]MDR6990517.1 TetR/AcrR family transcriptional regulator of autoinduction and epiphytic fitness [Luteimonas sp. 3794]